MRLKKRAVFLCMVAGFTLGLLWPYVILPK